MPILSSDFVNKTPNLASTNSKDVSKDGSGSVLGRTIGTITDVVGVVSKTPANLLGDVIDGATAKVARIADGVTNVAHAVEEDVTDVIGGVANTVTNVGDLIVEDTINNQIDGAAGSVLNVVHDTVHGITENVLHETTDKATNILSEASKLIGPTGVTLVDKALNTEVHILGYPPVQHLFSQADFLEGILTRSSQVLYKPIESRLAQLFNAFWRQLVNGWNYGIESCTEFIRNRHTIVQILMALFVLTFGPVAFTLCSATIFLTVGFYLWLGLLTTFGFFVIAGTAVPIITITVNLGVVFVVMAFILYLLATTKASSSLEHENANHANLN